LYDIEKNTYTDEIFFPDEISRSTEYIKLDDEHLIVIGNIKNQKVFIFNPFTKDVKPLAQFSLARSINPDMPIRPVITTDGKLIIFGGFKNEYENNFNMFDTTLKISDNAEIIDIKSGKVKLIKMLYKHAGNRSVILDDGRITDAQGRVVNFENTIICMTSNAGSNDKTASVGFNKTEGEVSKEKAMKALSQLLGYGEVITIAASGMDVQGYDVKNALRQAMAAAKKTAEQISAE
jgi:hypothetical protein